LAACWYLCLPTPGAQVHALAEQAAAGPDEKSLVLPFAYRRAPHTETLRSLNPDQVWGSPPMEMEMEGGGLLPAFAIM
jgi:hypothetical protein